MLPQMGVNMASAQAYPWFLAVLVGNDREQMRQWFHAANRHTGAMRARIRRRWICSPACRPQQGIDPSPAEPVLGVASNQPGPAASGCGCRRRSGRPAGPTALVSTPFDQVEITGEVNGDHASFLSHDDGTVHRFPRDLFLVEGGLPQAAE